MVSGYREALEECDVSMLLLLLLLLPLFLSVVSNSRANFMTASHQGPPSSDQRPQVPIPAK